MLKTLCKSILFGLSSLLFSGQLWAAEKTIPGARYAGNFDTRPVPIPAKRPAPAGELRGVWVATVRNLDFAQCQTAAEFRQSAALLCKTLRHFGANAIFFQVRPCNDAFYRSQLNPWSRFLTGTEGKALEGEKMFDPLTYLISEAHRNGLEFHAWLNPYRVIPGTKLSKKAYLKTLAPNNFARLHPEFVISVRAGSENLLVLNPAETQVRQFVSDTVMELVRNYAIDGIHFDDYFYPEHITPEADCVQFRKYNPRKLSLEDWRRENVTTLIRLVHTQIRLFNRSSKRKVRFGISPFGIWRNRKNSPLGSLTGGNESYRAQRADTRLWVKEKLIDYIAPQLYWHFGHDTASYAALTDWWCETVRGTGVALYIGQGLYRTDDKKWGINELYYQLMYNRAHPEVKGSILFSYRNLVRPIDAKMKKGGVEMIQSVWGTPPKR